MNIPATNKALTFFKMSGTFIICLLISFLNQSPAQAQSEQNVIIYADSTAQIIRGFGAANIVGWWPDMTPGDVENAFGMEDGQLGMSILRIRISPDENQWGDNLPTAQMAYDMGVKVIASPWSPPAEMKTNNELIGGSLRPDAYADYADHLNRFADFMEENGVPLYGISIQNEPDIQVSYESCDWTPEEMITFLRDHGDSIGPRIIAPESFQFLREMSDPILNDSLAAAQVDILGGHIYGGGNFRYPLAEQKGKEIWMTEYLLNLGTGNTGADPWSSYSEEEVWDETLTMLSSMQRSMRNNWNAYIWWYLQRYYSFIGDGDEGTENGEILKRGYAFAHFSRFVRPGYHRVHASVPFDVGFTQFSATAYKDMDSSQLVVIAVNGENSDREYTFTFQDSAPSQIRQFQTSLTQNLEQLENPDLDPDGRSFTATIPARSVTTFVGDEVQAVSNKIDENRNRPNSVQLRQNYPNPFNPSTTIHYRLTEAGNITLKVFDMTGREVATLTNGIQTAGDHRISFDATNLSSGIYIYRLQAGDRVLTRKMTLIK
ncbi:T9SS C-terminal target domain-containing protein [Rhodohalobacter sp. SW132]|uniref:T9SS type A sorting domain-containing protein n=1 Tax=Rhodohalobacter sp. SW132 TaxID=2293433 RepID=UPI000E2681ED|nr:T9SS type A sorting domain-containing protein [Rhodohalobacter sp. SW132]REL38127.1 T9SS C-terminal target domain-containing protein [Rhodohalobacter sp. SW132]